MLGSTSLMWFTRTCKFFRNMTREIGNYFGESKKPCDASFIKYHAKHYPGVRNRGLLVIEAQKIAKIAISQKVLDQFWKKKKTHLGMVLGHLFPDFGHFWSGRFGYLGSQSQLWQVILEPIRGTKGENRFFFFLCLVFDGVWRPPHTHHLFFQ